MYESHCALYYIYIDIGVMPKAWPMLINSIDLIGQLVIHVFDIYIFYTSKFLWTYYSYIPLLLMKSFPTLFMSCYWRLIKYYA